MIIIPSCNEIYNYFISEFEYNAKCLVPNDSDTGIKMKIIANELAYLFNKLEYYEKQIFPNTAEGIYLEKHGALRGIYKKPASKAKGKIVFETLSPADSDILIPQGTLCTSSKANNLVYQTLKPCTLKAGTTYTVADVESTESGAHTNIAPNLIDILVNPITKITKVSNNEHIVGGADAESDNVFRTRVIESFNKISNGANLNYYEEFAKSRPEVLYAKAVFSSNPTNQIILYVENYTRTITADEIMKIQKAVESVRELGIGVVVKKPTIKNLTISITAKVDNMGNESDYYNAVSNLITNKILELPIGARFSPAILSADILSVKGVKDLVFHAPTAPIELLNSEIVTLGNLTINIERT